MSLESPSFATLMTSRVSHRARRGLVQFYAEVALVAVVGCGSASCIAVLGVVDMMEKSQQFLAASQSSSSSGYSVTGEVP